MKKVITILIALTSVHQFVSAQTEQTITASDTTQFKMELPSPSGQYKIGTLISFVIDSTRFDSVSNKNGRKIVFEIRYPSKNKEGNTLKYIPNNLNQAMIKNQYYNIDSFSLLKWGQLNSYSFNSLNPLASYKNPILFFLHGFGVSRYNYISIIEELVSHGYIVVSIDSPNNGFHILPNGEIINTNYDENPVFKCESMAADVNFIYEHLKSTNNKKLIQLIRRIDFNKAGVFGHSLGGAAALESCKNNNRFKACINLDGDPFGKVEEAGFNKPTLILLNEPLFSSERFIKPGSKERWDSMGIERKNMWRNIFLKNNKVPAFAIRISGTNHFSFTDFPFVTHQYYRNSNAGIIINRDRGLLIITRYIRAFFDRYLLNNNLIDISRLTKIYPETNIQLFNNYL